MLSFVRGTITHVTNSNVTVDVNGVGFDLMVTRITPFEAGKLAQIVTYLHWSADNGPTLYGFNTMLERQVFLSIISCSGIGPKLALALLSVLTPEEFLHAIQTGDEKALSKVSGVGAKKAEQLVVQLKHKIAALLETASHTGAVLDPRIEQWKNIAQVLQSLNYSRQEVDAAINHIKADAKGQDLPFDLLMRGALSFLAKRM